jgi:hypothetical protein
MTYEKLPVMRFTTDYGRLEFDVDIHGDGRLTICGGLATHGDHTVSVEKFEACWSSFRFELITNWEGTAKVLRVCEHWETYKQDNQEVLPINGGFAAEGARMVQVYVWGEYHIVVNRYLGYAYITWVNSKEVYTLRFGDNEQGGFEFREHEFTVTSDELRVSSKSVVLSPLT